MTQSLAEACIRLATEHNFPVWLAVGAIYRGRALVEQGHIEAGLTQMQQGLADYEATGAKLSRSLFLATLAEVYGKTGQVEAGLSLLTEALIIANRSGERLYEAEIHRLKGASSTGVTRETAKSRLRYALAKLRRGMAQWR